MSPAELTQAAQPSASEALRDRATRAAPIDTLDAPGHADPTRPADRIQQAWAVLDTVADPELPALSLRDLGMVRGVRVDDGGSLEVALTPTYSGCPATEVIERSVLEALAQAGLGPARVRLQRAPAWTTDWISEAGRRKLQAYDIAPPGPVAREGAAPLRFMPRSPVPQEAVACPRCGSGRTERLSAFGSTACKALYRCIACREPFEHFKPL